MYQLDFNGAMQIVMSLMMGALIWFIKQSFKRHDDAMAKMNERVDAAESKNEKLREEFQVFLREAPIVYTLREDFLRVMNNVDEKLNRILYGKNGGDDG